MIALHIVDDGGAQDAHPVGGPHRRFQRLAELRRADDVTQRIHGIVLGAQSGKTEMTTIGDVNPGYGRDGCGQEIPHT